MHQRKEIIKHSLCSQKLMLTNLEDAALVKTANTSTKRHIADRGYNSMSLYHLLHLPILFLEAMLIPEAKVAVDKEWNTQKNLPAWQESKVIEEAQTEGNTVHVATLMDSCHLTSSVSDNKFQKYRGRGVTW